MSEQKRTSEQARKEILEGLVLPLGSEAMPFALIGDETNLGPEDWAWLFLSMSEKYADAYHEHAESKGVPYRDSDIEDAVGDNVWSDHDGACAMQFGLAAWLNPSTEALPKLCDRDDSWFFPLKRPIAEDYRRKEVGEKKYVRIGPTYSRQLDKHPHLVANETTFGYRRPLNFPTGPQSPDDMLGVTWVAIDCSIPPEGQLSALRTLAVANRERLMDHGWKTNDELSRVSVEEISDSEVFEHLRFTKSAGATGKVADLTTVWRATQIDALGPIVRQTEFLAKSLGAIHQKLLLGGLVDPPPFLRFKNTLPSVKDRDGEFRNGGSYVKALLVIAELVKWKKDANEIAQITAIVDENNRYQYNWQRQFHEDIERYMGEAQKMIDGGYRMLIHAQKPNASELD